MLLNVKTCVLVCFTNFVLNISRSTKNSARYYYKCRNIFTWTADYSCQILNKLEFSLQVFEKFSNTKFQENLSSGSRVVPDGRTDMTKLTVAFRNFANAPKNVVCATPKVLNANKINYRVHTILIKVCSSSNSPATFSPEEDGLRTQNVKRYRVPSATISEYKL